MRARDRTEATRMFLQRFRNSQMFERWADQRAALALLGFPREGRFARMLNTGGSVNKIQ